MSVYRAFRLRAAFVVSAFSAVGVFAHLARAGEVLYNGIVLPNTWPPRHVDVASGDVPDVPYLRDRPATVPIDVGRQLFVDDFLIEATNMKRTFHAPVKYSGNPVLHPESKLEMDHGISPTAVPFSDGVFFDPQDHLFKMWYMAGWFETVGLVTSVDGIHWIRPNLDVVPGTNRVIAPYEDRRRDGVTVWLDRESRDADQRFKMFLYARTGKVGGILTGGAGYLLTSRDGVHWVWRGQTGPTDDNTGYFYNPFRKVWVFSHRSWTPDASHRRARSYWETPDFLTALGSWKGYNPVFWVGTDRLDRPDPSIGDPTQLYKVDATPYESIMLGLFQVHYGPSNRVCAERGVPKLTQLEVGFSRDGFHWDRANRAAFVAAGRNANKWDRGYISSVGGCCLVVGDKLYFYYSGFHGDESHAASFHGSAAEQGREEMWSGMYANASAGLAVLRRDGFASLDCDGSGGVLTTRLVRFSGTRLFVNADCSKGALRVEVLDEKGAVIPSLTAQRVEPMTIDSTIHEMRWRGGATLGALAGKRVRFRFYVDHGKLYSFWVSKEASGASHGYVAGGGPGFTTDVDTVGNRGYADAQTAANALNAGEHHQ